MGQGASSNLATYSLLSTVPESTSHDPLAELGREVSYERSLGSSRCLRSIKGRQQRKDGLAAVIVVKVFFKPSSSVNLKPFSKRLKQEREALADLPNVLPYSRILETERAGYMLRPWASSSLYDRISTRPFLTVLEKKWVAFQLLTALSHARSQGIAHGDIKSENILVTSSLWVYITDFSSPFKPTMLPLDDPAEFSYFFDSSGRRTCYLAPERFYPSSQKGAASLTSVANADGAQTKTHEAAKGKVSEAMDVFSAGCVLAELFCDGVPPFSLSQLFRYRNGEYTSELEVYLSQIEDKDIRNMCKTMLSLDPSHRLGFTDHIENSAFPSFLPTVHQFFSALQSAMRFNPPTLAQTSGTSNTPLPTQTPVNLNDIPPPLEPVLHTASDLVIERLVAEWSSVVQFLGPDAPKADTFDESKSLSGAEAASPFPLRLAIPGYEIALPDLGSSPSPQTDDPAALLFLAFLSANIRNCLRPSRCIEALELLLYLSRVVTDETVLDRILPYVVYFLNDEAGAVRSMAVRVLTQLLLLIEVVTPANISVIMDYVMPNVSPLVSDPDAAVRTAYAWCLAPLADCGERFMSMMGKLRSPEKSAGPRDEVEETALETSYDSKMEELREVIQEQLSLLLLTDKEPAVKRAILSSVVPLCFFFGRAKAADVLLSQMVTFLNEMDWQLRSAFFESAVGVVSYIGLSAVEDVVIPLMLRSLTDPEEFVTPRVLLSLSTLSELGLVPRSRIWELLDCTTGFICHPNIWIRQASAGLVASLSRSLDQADVWSALYPPLRKLLRSDLATITETGILDVVVAATSRQGLAKDAASLLQVRETSMQLPKQLDSKDESRDPTIRLLLDRLVQENTPSTPAEFGPYIADGVPKRRAVRTSLLAREKSALPRPDGTLIGHLAEHSGAVTGIVSSPDNVFFVSASEDGTLRVWDSVRLERNVTSRSRQTIHLNHPVTALCRLEHTHCVAAATKSGSISVHRINVRLDGALPKHEKPEAIRQYQFTRPGEHATAIAHYQQENLSHLICGTTHSRICILDINSMEEINVLTLPPYFGSFTCLCLDPKASWVACGTNTGHLAIWDLRFNLLIKTIRITRQDERAKSVTSCVVHPSKGKGRHLILALQGDAEGHSSAIQVWDIEHGIKTEEFITGSRRSEQPVTPDQTCANPTTASEAIEAFLNRQGGSSAAANSERVDAVYTLAVGSDYTAMGDSRFGNAETTVTTAASADDSFTHVNQHTCFMLSGGEDRHLRFWDLNNVEQSMILLSPEDNKSATYTLTSSHADAPNICVYEETAVAGPTRLRPTAIALAQQNMLRAHQDAITAVALLQLPYKTIITGDRKGVIKVSS